MLHNRNRISMDETAPDRANDTSTAVAEPAIEEPQQKIEPKSADPKDEKQNQTKRQPPYAVILHNDDKNTIDFVIATLRKVFHYDQTRAIMLTMQAHKTGRSIVWTGMREHAELKADQIRSCGPDPIVAHLGAAALSVSIEPLPS
jgi:ATP-dependent Clp protease adaptor protein ClpS